MQGFPFPTVVQTISLGQDQGLENGIPTIRDDHFRFNLDELSGSRQDLYITGKIQDDPFDACRIEHLDNRTSCLGLHGGNMKKNKQKTGQMGSHYSWIYR